MQTPKQVTFVILDSIPLLHTSVLCTKVTGIKTAKTLMSEKKQLFKSFSKHSV